MAGISDGVRSGIERPALVFALAFHLSVHLVGMVGTVGEHAMDLREGHAVRFGGFFGGVG